MSCETLELWCSSSQADNLGLFLGNSSHYFVFLVFDNWILIPHLNCLHAVGAEGSKSYCLKN